MMRIKGKLSHLSQNEWGKVVGMLIDDQFTIDEVIDVLKDEKIFNE